MAVAAQHAIIVSHTHWDREWYQPFEEFRLALVRVVDQLLAIMDADPDNRCFLLDGQTIVLEDYLEARPERREALAALVRAGRVQIGPWYVQPDEFLVSPEALVRNLLIGRAVGEAFGPVLVEGYVPDSFGHIAQLPQILRGFGIDSAFFWRGLGDEGEALGADFWWEAPDGTRVLAHWLSGGYFDAVNLGYPAWPGDTAGRPFDRDAAQEMLVAAADAQRPYARTGAFLLMNGMDHVPAQAEIPAIVREANRRHENVQVEQGTLADYKRRVLSSGIVLPSYRGELRGGRYAPILQGVHATRIYLKGANAAAQTLLERYVEPLVALSPLLGGTDDRALLTAAWKTLLKNHPHDDICGCSVEAVHDAMTARFADVMQRGVALVREHGRALAAAIAVRADAGVPLVVFNALGHDRDEVLVTTLELDTDDPCAREFSLYDELGQVVPSQILAQEDRMAAAVGLTTWRRVHAVTLAVAARGVPGLGYRTYYRRPPHPDRDANPPRGAWLTDRGMENERLRVLIDDDGTITLTDKAAGRAYAGLLAYEDSEDAGDTYTYSRAAEGRTITSRGGTAQVTPLAAGPMRAEVRVTLTLSLPISLAEDRRRRHDETRPVTITSIVSLGMGERLVRVRTTVDNTVRDHRLRVLFPGGVATDRVHAGGHFDVIERPVDPVERIGWREQPGEAAPSLGFVDVADAHGDRGLAVLAPGLPEYAALRGDDGVTLALTLLRCVGWLGRSDVPARPENAALDLATPGAQCQGRQQCDYAILPHAGGWEDVPPAAAGVAAPLRLLDGATALNAGVLPERAALLSIRPASVILSALKPGMADGALIARCYSLAPTVVRASLRTLWALDEAFRTDLGERGRQPLRLANDGHGVAVEIRPREIVTIALYPRTPLSTG